MSYDCQDNNPISSDMVLLMNRIPVLRFLKEPARTLEDLSIKYPDGLSYGSFALVSPLNADSYFAEWRVTTRTWEPISGDIASFLNKFSPITDQDFFEENKSRSTSSIKGYAIRVGDVWTNIISSINGESINYQVISNWYDGTSMDDTKVDGTIYRKRGNEYMKLVYSGAVNAKWFGAKGNNVTDDTEALTKAFNYAFKARQGLYVPKGDYVVTAPIRIEATSSFTPICPEIYGDGVHTVFNGTILEADRAVIEIIGISNPRSVSFVMRDFRIRQKNSHVTSMCLLFGDAKNSASLKRINFDGNNGVGIKISSSASYSQINTIFENCYFRSNIDAIVPETECQMYAVRSLSGGAKWDNIKFISCWFSGLVQTRGHVVDFDTCQFSTNPNRPIVGSTFFGANVEVRIGNANFNSCYFEDHYYGVVINPSIDNVDFVNFKCCHFSSVTNFSGGECKAGVYIARTNATRKLGYISLDSCTFGDYRNDAPLYADGSIVAVYNALLNVTNCVNKYDYTRNIRIVYPTNKARLLVKNIGNTDTPSLKKNEKCIYKCSSSDNAIKYPHLPDSNISAITFNYNYLINKFILYTNRVFEENENVVIYILKNGARMMNFSTNSLTKVINADGFWGYRVDLGVDFVAGDTLSLQMILNSTSYVEINCTIELFISESI